MRKILSILSFLILVLACREPYEPEITQQSVSALVVEGYLDTEGLTSELLLSRTVSMFRSMRLLRLPLRSERGSLFLMKMEEPIPWQSKIREIM